MNPVKYLKISFVFTLLAIIALSTPQFTQAKRDLPQDVENALSSIQTEEGMAIISELASDRYEGRLTGTSGYNLAAEFVGREFSNAGLEPFGGKDSFFQRFQLATNKILPTPVLEVQTGTVEYTNYRFGTDFICFGFSGSGDVREEVIFCGYGITTDKHDDYAGMDVKGKIVLMMAGHPKNQNDLYEWDTSSKKITNAMKHGAAAILSVRSTPEGNIEDPIVSAYWGDNPHQDYIPIVVIGKFAALDIFRKSRQELPLVQNQINVEKHPASFNTHTIAHVRVEADFSPLKDTKNVVGLLEGSDPRLKDEYIVLGAHLDHVGLQGNDVIFPGANDNASGIAGLIEVAEAFGELKVKPKRSIIFVAFAGEEMGLKGSNYFVENPPVDKKKIKAMVNLDMIGDGNSKLLCFAKEFPSLVKTAEKANDMLYQMDMPVINVGYASDHFSFKKAGIPAMMFLNGGEYSYPNYHQHCHYRDWMINIGLWKKTSETTFLTLWYLAN